MAAPPDSPPQVGVPVTKASLDAKIGALATNSRKGATGYQELIDFKIGRAHV